MSKYYTVGGLKFSDAKSGLQKAIRRGMTKEAIAYAVEMDRYPTGEQKGNRTNLINRLKIILVEDVCEPGLIPILTVWFEKWHSTRETTTSRRYLLSIVHSLSNARKLRITSDYKFFTEYEAYRKTLGDKYDFLYTKGDSVKDPNFLRFIDKSKFTAYGYVYDQYLERIYNTFPKTNTEKWLYSLASGVYLHLNIDSSLEGEEPELMSQKKVDCVYDVVSEYKPPYKSGWLPENIVCDIHTGKKRDSEAMCKFALEGAKVENERLDHKNIYLRYLYNENKKNYGVENQVSELIPSREKWTEDLYKKVLPNKKVAKKAKKRVVSPSIDFLSDPIFAQKVTAFYKPYTFITREKIYKGPYDKDLTPLVKIAQRFEELGDDSVMVPDIISINSDKSYYTGKYLVYPNIGLNMEENWPPKVKWDLVKKYPKSSSVSEVYGNIAERGSVGIYQGAKLIEMGKMDFKKMVWHFFVRFILGRGDAGLWNYINNYGVDFEEERKLGSFDDKDIFGTIFIKSPKEKDVILPWIKKYKKEFVDRLESLDLTKDENLRRNILVSKLKSI